jgi:hypothetical protein
MQRRLVRRFHRVTAAGNARWLFAKANRLQKALLPPRLTRGWCPRLRRRQLGWAGFLPPGTMQLYLNALLPPPHSSIA